MSDSSSDIDDSVVDNLIQRAFTNTDPGPSLLQVIQEHPTHENIEEPVVRYYMEALENDPSRGQALASALAKLNSLSFEINRELCWVLFKADFDNDNSYGPKNRFLFHSLLSGLSLKYQLNQNSAMLTSIVKGLDPQSVDAALFNSQTAEVLVVGACIQLLLHGYAITTDEAGPYYRRTPEVVAKNLKERKVEGVLVKDPRAVQVLELAITHAETGLIPENERDDVWDLLFSTNQN